MTVSPRAQAIVLSAAVILLSFPDILRAQGETAFPFLLYSPAPDGNGWGNISTAVPSDNPIAVTVNPGQLGFFSLGNNFAASAYPAKTDLGSYFGRDITYNAWGLSAAYNISNLLSLPFSLGVGFGYSRIDLDLGTFVVTSSGGPDILATIHVFDKSESFSAGIGIEYFVRLGAGWNFKKVSSVIEVISGTPPTPAGANVSTSDFGLILQAPFGDLIDCKGTDSMASSISPLLDLTFAYTVANRGDELVVYSGLEQGDPLPRNAIAGMSVEVGITKEVLGKKWKILTFTIAREADDLLVTRYDDGSFEYQDGLGDISFLTNVIGGKADEDGVNSRKGWQLNFAEFVLLRHGSYTDLPYQGGFQYSTSGYAFHLSGGLKLIEAILPGSTSGPIASYLREHIDLAFDHSEYTDDAPFGGHSFDALTLVFR